MTEKNIMVVLGADVSGFKSAMDTVQSSTKTAVNGAATTFDGAGESATKNSGVIKNAFVGLGPILAGAFALDKIKDFGVGMVESAATAQAVNAQFSNTYRDVADGGIGDLNRLADTYNILPERLKPTMSAVQSFFLGSGADAQTSADMTEKAMNLAANGAAYYDKSLEDVGGSLKSFLMGNYEAGDAIGVSTNATKIAEAYNAAYGGSFDALTESQKSDYLLEYVEGVYAANGAMSAGTDEANSWGNVIGNAKATWENFTATLGAAILPTVTEWIQSLSEWLGKVDVEAITAGFQNFGSYLSDVFGPTIDTVKGILQGLWDKFAESGGIETAKGAIDGVKSAFAWFQDNGEAVTAILGGLLGGLLAFKTITSVVEAISSVKTAITTLKKATSLANLAQQIFNGTLLANPFTWVALAIGVLIAAIILIWQNWDQVSAWLQASWATIKEVATSIFSAIGEFLSGVWEGIKTVTSNVWEAIKSAISTAIDAISNFVSTTFNSIKSTVSNIWEGIKSTISDAIQGAKDSVSSTVDGISSVVNSVFEGIQNTVTGIWDGIKESITGAIDGAKNAVSTAVEAIKGFMDFSWSLPPLKMPKVSVDMKKNDWGIPYPDFNVSWMATGGIATGASVVGVGEAGDEAIVPLSNKSRMRPFAEAVAKMMPEQQGTGGNNDGAIYQFEIPVMVDGRQIAKATAEFTQKELDKLKVRQNRLQGVRA